MIRAAFIISIILTLQWDRAARLVEDGELEAAEREYRALVERDAADLEATYNLGTVLLMLHEYDEARSHLERVAQKEGPLEEVAAYNLGNSDLEPAHADSLLADRESRLRRAIEAYKMALLANPEDGDAKWNLELARRLLERERPTSNAGGGGGGSGQGTPREAEPDRVPASASGGDRPRMAAEQAEELLRSAREQELQVQREGLRRPQPPGPIRP